MKGDQYATFKLGEASLSVRCQYEVEPPEPDIGIYGGVILNAVMLEDLGHDHDGGDILGALSSEQIDDLCDQVATALEPVDE